MLLHEVLELVAGPFKHSLIKKLQQKFLKKPVHLNTQFYSFLCKKFCFFCFRHLGWRRRDIIWQTHQETRGLIEIYLSLKAIDPAFELHHLANGCLHREGAAACVRDGFLVGCCLLGRHWQRELLLVQCFSDWNLIEASIELKLALHWLTNLSCTSLWKKVVSICVLRLNFFSSFIVILKWNFSCIYKL